MDMFEELLTASSGRGVDPEVLEMLGRRASTLFLEKKASLNDAVKQVTENHGGLNSEHIKRVVEFANTFTFQQMFEKSADKNVHFPVADPGVVIRDLRDGGSPAHAGKTMKGGHDYSTPPAMEKNDFADAESGLNQLFLNEGRSGIFGQGEQIKTASGIEIEDLCGHSDPVADVDDLRIKLERSRHELVAAHERFDMLVKTAKEELFRAVKQEVLDPYGAGLGGVMAVMEKVSADLAPDTLSQIVVRLTNEGVNARALERSMQKTAGAVVNPQHPVVLAFTGLIKAAERQVETAGALAEIENSHREVMKFIKKASR